MLIAGPCFENCVDQLVSFLDPHENTHSQACEVQYVLAVDVACRVPCVINSAVHTAPYKGVPSTESRCQAGQQ